VSDSSRSAAPLLFAVGLALIVAVAAVGTPADADLWGHLQFGGDIVRSRLIVQVDQYSFTSDRPWINHEWLSEVFFYSAYRLGGSIGLVALKIGAIGAALTMVWLQLRRTSRLLFVTIVWVAVAFAGVYWRTHTVRPQLFSVVLFAGLLAVLDRSKSERAWTLWLIPPLMALWVNLHGGWVVGLGALGCWTAVRLLDSSLSVRFRLAAAIAALAGVSATLLNPYGVRMWWFLAETVRFSRADIEEWGSVLTYPLALGIPWAIVLGAGVWSAWRARVRRLDVLLITVGLAIASFRVSRLDAFFALAVVMLLAPAAVRSAQAPETRFAPAPLPAGVLVITLIAVIAMLVPAVRIVGPFASCLTIGGAWVPDVDAGRFIAQNRLTGRMLTWFDWGEYAIWQFGPTLKVSMDGRRETVYTESTIQAHRRFYAGDDDALAYLDRLAPDFVWLPAHLPMTGRLRTAGWISIFTSARSLVFARAGAGPFSPLSGTAPIRRCFPGP
jgi:hypothetical protein